MMKKKKIEDITSTNSRFCSSALEFVYEGLGYTVKNTIIEPGHVTGQTLSKGLAKLAVEKWGRLAKLILNQWGIKSTRDFGEIVYLLIDHKWMSAQSTDSIDDFNDVYDFETVFKEQFEF